MTDSELIELIQELRDVGTDHSSVEAKSAAEGFPKRLWESISAFANTSGGGVIVLGVDERKKFEICGVSDPKKFLSDLASVCDQMDPPVRAHIKPHRFDDKTVIVAEIPEVNKNQKPCFYKGAGQMNGSFVRVSDGDRQLTSYEVQLLISSRSQPRDDEQSVKGAVLGDLDNGRVEAFVKAVRSRSRNYSTSDKVEILKNFKAITSVEGEYVPTLAGLLTLGRYPERFFPALCVQFVRYPGTSVGAPGDQGERFLDNRKLEGTIGLLLDETLAVLSQHMVKKTIIKGSIREDIWQYPETALREVVVNALVHRDFSQSACGSPVQIHMFADRLVIRNPGGLFGPVTVHSLGVTGTSAARNASLIRILEELPERGGAPVCENRGSGIGAMINALRKAGMEPPTFDDSISTFAVTFPNAALLDDETIRWIEKIAPNELTDTQRLGLALLKHGNYLDNTRYRQATGLDSRVATKELGELSQLKLIEQIGTKRWATYRLASGTQQRRDRRAEIVSLLRQKGELSRAEIADALMLSNGATRQWLAKLRSEEQVEIVGPAKSPSARYRVSKRRRK